MVDTVLSTSCFSGSPKSEKLSGVQSTLASLDSSPGSKRLIEHVHSKAMAQAVQKDTIQPGDNNNMATGAEQVSPRHGAASKELRQRNGAADVGTKRMSTKTALESERSPKKRPATSSTSSSSLSPASPAADKLPSRQAKSAASASKEKNDGVPKTSKAGSSRTATPSKKGSSHTSEALQAESALQRKGGSPGSQNSQPQRRNSPRGGGEKSSSSGRMRAADRSTSRDSSRTSAVPDRKVNPGGPASRSSAASRADGRLSRAAENRAMGRSSSSSSSMTSLRSSSVSSAALPSRGPQRSSKTEEKGLSFFKTALRPKETHKSTDGGKGRVGECKGSPEDVSGDAVKEGIQNGGGKKGQNVASESKNSMTNTAKDKETIKASSSAKHSLLPSTKSKLSGAETTPSAKDPSKKEPAKKTMQSRKIPISSTQTSQRAK